jgi:hypothetical protein
VKTLGNAGLIVDVDWKHPNAGGRSEYSTPVQGVYDDGLEMYNHNRSSRSEKEFVQRKNSVASLKALASPKAFAPQSSIPEQGGFTAELEAHEVSPIVKPKLLHVRSLEFAPVELEALSPRRVRPPHLQASAARSNSSMPGSPGPSSSQALRPVSPAPSTPTSLYQSMPATRAQPRTANSPRLGNAAVSDLPKPHRKRSPSACQVGPAPASLNHPVTFPSRVATAVPASGSDTASASPRMKPKLLELNPRLSAHTSPKAVPPAIQTTASPANEQGLEILSPAVYTPAPHAPSRRGA